MKPEDRGGELRPLLLLALPLIVGQAGTQLMSFVDAAMVGRLGKAALGGVGIGNGIFFTITCLGIGLVLGADAPLAQATGAGEPARARRILWQALRVAALVSVPLMVAVALAPALLAPLRVDPEAAAQCRAFLLARTLNVLPLLLFIALRAYVQAVGTTRPIIVATVVGNVVNLVANALLIYGDAALETVGLPGVGLPRLGATGSGLASTVASVAMAAVVALAVAAIPAPEDPSRRRRDPELTGTILRLGLPFGLQVVAEVGVFCLAAILAGTISGLAAAANQVAITLASLPFCVTLGIGTATSVRVGIHIGAGDTARARRAGVSGLIASGLFMTQSAVLFLVFPERLAGLLTDDREVIEAAVPLLRIAAVFALSDGTQATAAGALRGAGDARAPLYANLIGHYAVGLPLAIGLGFGLGWGAVGLWWGLSAGLTAVAIGLTGRFLVLSSRPIARV